MKKQKKNTTQYYKDNEKVYGEFLHEYSIRNKIPLGQIKYHKKNFQYYFKLSSKKLINKSILDTGSGPGIHSAILCMLGLKVTAVDLSRENILKVKKIKKIYNFKNLKFRLHDLSKPLKLKEKFDLISCHNWIQHTPNPYIIIKNLSKNLKIGGRFYISCYQTFVFRCFIAKICRSILTIKNFDKMKSTCLNLFPLGFKTYKNYDHAQFGLMFDDFFTPFFKTISYQELKSDFESLGFKLITKIPKFKDIKIEHMPYVRMGFEKVKNNIKKNYRPNFSRSGNNFKLSKNKISNTSINLAKKIIKKFKSKKINEMDKILFCASLFDLSSNFSNDKSYEKYRYLNSFLDRVLNKNYEYFPPFNLIKKDKIIYKL